MKIMKMQQSCVPLIRGGAPTCPGGGRGGVRRLGCPRPHHEWHVFGAGSGQTPCRGPAVAGMQVMQALKSLADEGRTVVCSIHQPRSSIFAMFDDLLLLAEGTPVYSGPAQDAAPYFEAQARSGMPPVVHATAYGRALVEGQDPDTAPTTTMFFAVWSSSCIPASTSQHACMQGFRMPENYNPAEFLADLISTDTSSQAAEAASRCAPAHHSLHSERKKAACTVAAGAVKPWLCYCLLKEPFSVWHSE